MNLPEVAKDTGDVASVIVAFGTLAEWFPKIAALLAIVWTGIRIYVWLRTGKVND